MAEDLNLKSSTHSCPPLAIVSPRPFSRLHSPTLYNSRLEVTNRACVHTDQSEHSPSHNHRANWNHFSGH